MPDLEPCRLEVNSEYPVNVETLWNWQRLDGNFVFYGSSSDATILNYSDRVRPR